MGVGDQQRGLDEAFERIEETILPSISLMLDTLLEAAQLGDPRAFQAHKLLGPTRRNCRTSL